MSNSQKPPPSFEFTKRKRWGDLLITELADCIILVLDRSCKVLYCGPAVTELLGWKDTELVDCNFLSLICDEDHSLFRTCFEESVRTNVDLLVHSRLKTSSNPTGVLVTKPILFEIKGRPHFLNGECVCFFTSARPYQSRNTVTLNTMLDLKIENERLQQRLRDLKGMLRNSTVSQPYISSVQLGQTRMQGSSSLIGATGTQGNYYPDTQSGHLRNTLDNTYGSTLLSAEEDNPEDGSKRKKAKKNASDQYVCVTCGRTDSPEWRKGPLGPKTLCNACGLRWAKQMRKTDEPVDHDV